MRQYDALTVVKELFHFGYWLAQTYTQGSKPASGPSFDATLPPSTRPLPQQALDQRQQLEAKMRESDEKPYTNFYSYGVQGVFSP